VVSVDDYKRALRSQMNRAAAHGATNILINGGELRRTLGKGRGAMDDCCKAMREELKPGDTVLIEPDASVGMTARYMLPRNSR
jgi:hypothetical protein